MVTDLQNLTLVLLLAVATVYDVREKRIPNWLALLGFGFALVFAWSTPDHAGARQALYLGLLIGGGALLLLYLGGGVGGGDVKLGATVGLLAGYPDIIRYLIFGGLAALAIVLGRLAWRGEVLATFWSMLRAKPHLIHPHPNEREPDVITGLQPPTVSFAVWLAFGVVWVWVMSAL